MILFLEGMLTMLGALVVVGVALAYLIDWDQVIREATDELECEWGPSHPPRHLEEYPEPTWDYEHG